MTKKSTVKAKKIKKEIVIKDEEVLAPETLPQVEENKTLLETLIPKPDSRAENPATISISTTKNYITAKWRQLGEFILTKVDSFTTVRMKKVLEGIFYYAEYEREQILWRSRVAKKCTALGYCIDCGCNTKGYDKYRGSGACEKEGCYPAMMNKTEWEKFKKDNSITI
jgi:hypothetical protein